MPDTSSATIFGEVIPCDGCPCLPRCRRVPVSCAAFHEFVEGRPWGNAPRVPSREVYRRTYGKLASIRATMRERRARVAAWNGSDRELGQLCGVSAVTIAKDRAYLGKVTRFNGSALSVAERRARVAQWQGTDTDLAALIGCTSALIGLDRKALGIATKFLGGPRRGGGAPRGPRKSRQTMHQDHPARIIHGEIALHP